MKYKLKEGWWVSTTSDHKMKQASKVTPILSWMLAEAGPNHSLAVVELDGALTLLDVSSGDCLEYTTVTTESGAVKFDDDSAYEERPLGGEVEKQLECGSYSWTVWGIRDEFGEDSYISQ